jgi:hypothetical protein
MDIHMDLFQRVEFEIVIGFFLIGILLLAVLAEYLRKK